MALNSNQKPFGFDMEEKFKKVGRTDTDKHTHTDTDTDTDTHAYTDAVVIEKETKSKRLYLLAKPSVHKKLDAYAKASGNTFNNLVHELMEKFIEEKGL